MQAVDGETFVQPLLIIKKDRVRLMNLQLVFTRYLSQQDVCPDHVILFVMMLRELRNGWIQRQYTLQKDNGARTFGLNLCNDLLDVFGDHRIGNIFADIVDANQNENF